MEESKKVAERRVNKPRLLFGLLLVILATIVSVKYFNTYNVEIGKQAAGVFVCVIAFVSGILVVFSSMHRTSRWNYFVTPAVVILGVIFVMNYLYYSGIAQVITEYPKLKAEKNKISDMKVRLAEEETLNRMLATVNHIKTAELLIKTNGDFREAANQLRLAKESLGRALPEEEATLNQLIEALDQIPPDLMTRLSWLSIDVEKRFTQPPQPPAPPKAEAKTPEKK